jgi:tetratricopeptide (TPR) repeat protein
MPNLRWYWIVIYSISLLLTSCGGKKTAEAIKAESHKSVALISHLKGHGVGFFIEGAAGICTVLTAKHVVPNGKEISILTMTSKLPFKSLDIRRADNADLAVVTFKPLDGNCPFPALKLGDSNNVVLTQPIYISSYPGGANGQAPKQSFYISSVTDKTPGGADGYELGYKTDTLGGTSGSPVLNEFGEVIAIHGRSYMNKDSNLLVNDRAYLDLAIPINIYKQNPIAKVITVEIKVPVSNDFFEKGYRNYNLGNMKEAIDAYDKVIELEPSNSSAYNNRGIAKSALGKKVEAIADYNLAIKINPNYSSAYNNRGIAKSDLGKKVEAIADYNLAIKINPNNSSAYNNRGIAKSALGKKVEAISDYNLAIKINPNNSSAYNNRGIAKSALGKKVEAIADYNLAIKINPNYSSAYDNRGIAKSDLGNKVEAIADYNLAIKINPNNSDAYYNRGIAKSALGKKVEAIADYNLAIKINPNYSSAYDNRGIAKSDLGNKVEAIADYNLAIKINPNNSDAYYNRGIAKSALGKKEDAKVDYKKSAALYLQQGKKKDYQDALNQIKRLKI